MARKLYTIGEIYRNGMLLNHKGQPYSDKSTVARIVNRLNYSIKQTPWGTAKVVGLKEIKHYNEATRIL